MNPSRRSWRRRLLPSLPLSAAIFVFWLLLGDTLDAGSLLMAALLAWLIPLAAARLDREFAQIGSLRPLPKLLWVIAVDIIQSNLQVARQIFQSQAKLQPGFVWIPLDIGNIHGITALTSIITLTPGTVSVSLSKDRQYLLIHVLDLQDSQALINQIKQRYERPLMEIFP